MEKVSNYIGYWNKFIFIIFKNIIIIFLIVFFDYKGYDLWKLKFF